MENHDHIIAILKELHITYTQIEHEESRSCEDSKRLRDAAGLMGQGSKNIVFHAKGKYYLVTTLAEKSIKARNFKHEFGTKDIRFASQEEITPTLGAMIGSIPPFWFENTLIPVYVDAEIFNHEYFLFNPSVPTKSIRIATAELRKIYDSMKNPVQYFQENEEWFKLVRSI